MKRLRDCLLLILLCGTAPAFAEQPSQAVELSLFPDYRAQVQLADATESGSLTQAPPQSTIDAEVGEFREPLFTPNKMHQYLGFGSIALATLALLSPKEEEGPHSAFATGAAVLGGAAVASGLIVHGEDVGPSYGVWDPDNQHAVLATLGALGFIAAVAQGGEENHAVYGVAGYVAMAIGIRLNW
ncbi:MAG TPA: hypothetical protein VGE50_13410 [Gammaproteobacteria bacterium]